MAIGIAYVAELVYDFIEKLRVGRESVCVCGLFVFITCASNIVSFYFTRLGDRIGALQVGMANSLAHMLYLEQNIFGVPPASSSYASASDASSESTASFTEPIAFDRHHGWVEPPFVPAPNSTCNVAFPVSLLATIARMAELPVEQGGVPHLRGIRAVVAVDVENVRVHWTFGEDRATHPFSLILASCFCLSDHGVNCFPDH